MDKYEEYEAVISALPDMVFVLTETGRYAGIFGGNSHLYHEPSKLKNMTLFDVLPEEKARWFLEKIHHTIASNQLQIVEYSLSASDVQNIDSETGPSGEIRFEGHVNPLSSLRDGEQAVVWVARNITSRYLLEQHLKYQSETDYLSNTYNRRKLFNRLNDAFYLYKKAKQKANFILFDIDNFKQINDLYGHHIGDIALNRVAELCHTQLRKTDALGRVGGDEFGIIQFNTPIESAASFADRLNQAIINLTDKELPDNLSLSVSMGISQFNDSDIDAKQIYQRADAALYEAKRNGKSTFSLNV